MSGSGTVPTLPTVMEASGLTPQAPADLLAQLVSIAVTLSPGVTTDLPGTLIGDLAGTGTGALSVMDAMRVELINSISPLGANPFLLYQMGQQFGIPQGGSTNGSAYVVFTVTDNSGNLLAGYTVPIGFTVSDGSNQYTVQDGGVTATSGSTQPLFVVATQDGVFPIPEGSIDQVISSTPGTYNVACTNPLNGTPEEGSETISTYRNRVLTAGQVAATGTPQFIKTLVNAVPGVNSSLTSVRVTSGGIEVITAGSGDPYLIAGAIFQGVADPSRLVGSTLGVAAFTAANPGAVTTTLNHGFTTGQIIAVSGATPSAYNRSYTINVTGEKTFTVGVNTTTFGTYATGGVITPNFRNQTISISQYPDVYAIPFVIAPSQTVTMAVQWSSISPNFVSATSVGILASTALSQYVNGLPIGAPISVDICIATFQNAVATALPPYLISALSFSVAINGIATAPNAGTVLIYGDPEGFFLTNPSAIVVENT